MDKDVINKAKEMRIDLSTFLELKLRIFGFSKNTIKEELADPAGFEPAIYGLEGRRSIHAKPRALDYKNFIKCL